MLGVLDFIGNFQISEIHRLGCFLSAKLPQRSLWHIGLVLNSEWRRSKDHYYQFGVRSDWQLSLIGHIPAFATRYSLAFNGTRELFFKRTHILIPQAYNLRWRWKSLKTYVIWIRVPGIGNWDLRKIPSESHLWDRYFKIWIRNCPFRIGFLEILVLNSGLFIERIGI